MKKTHRILQLMILLKIIEISDFYAISLHQADLQLQGHFNSNGLNQKLQKLFPKIYLNTQGYMSSQRTIQGISVEITLT